jgi:hypothetical protein
MFLDIIHRPVFIEKHGPVYFSEYNVSETGFCLRLQVKPTQLGPIDRVVPISGDRDKDRAMDNVQKHNICTNVPSSQTFRSYLEFS